MEVTKITTLKNINLLISRIEKMSNKDTIKLQKQLNDINPDIFEQELQNIDTTEHTEIINNEQFKNRISYLSFKLKLKTLFLNSKAKKIIFTLCKYGLAFLVINYLPTTLMMTGNTINAFSYVDSGANAINNVLTISSNSLISTISANLFLMLFTVFQVFNIILAAMFAIQVGKFIAKMIKDRDFKIKQIKVKSVL